MTSSQHGKSVKRKKKEYEKQSIWPHLLAGIASFLFLLCLIGIAAVGVCCLQAPDLSGFDPDPEDFYAVILDENGDTLESSGFSSTARKAVSLDEISTAAQTVFLEVLDPDYYEERGLEEEGAITFRLLESTVFYNQESPSGWLKETIRRIQEEYLALFLERDHTKEWILEKYLNTIDFGKGIRGIREASVYYFQELPEKLTEEQAGILVSYAEQAGESEVTETNLSDYFQQTLLESVAADLVESCGYTEAEAWNAIYNGGLKIYSTENQRLQKLCSENAEKSAYNRNQEQVSIVMTDNETGAVAAIIGGRKTSRNQSTDNPESDTQDNGFGEHGEELDAEIISGGAAAKEREKAAASEKYINRAVELRRQPGETLAVLGQYAAGLDSGTYTLASILDDVPCEDRTGNEIDPDETSYQGKITVHEAIETGNRIASYQSYLEIGEESVREMLTEFGLSGLSEESDVNLALGETQKGVTNLELNAAYGTIARGGNYIEPYFYTKVTDQNGKVILEHQTEKTRVIQKTTADLLTIAMENVISRSAAYEKVNSAQIAGISCSTENNRDVWFSGFSPYYTCTVWGGNDDGSSQEDGTYVQQLWREIMDEAHEDISDASDRQLVDTGDLIKVQICTKCGKRAIAGLCDTSMQGNKSEEEYFVRGSSPAKDCDCHVKISICTESDKLASSHCPSSSVITGVYLRTATPGTEDEKYCSDQLSTEECDLHKGIFGK